VTVTALLVSHDGARWLPAVLDALEKQDSKPDRVVAVDTGSDDASLDLLRERLGADNVVSAPANTSYPEAVRRGTDHLGPGADTDWVWLLHDDSAPAPDALWHLLAVAEEQPSVSVLGPKLREWPSLRRLLEVGVTMSGTGRRETGLERGEYDQGQHDRQRDVLAVNTAGMLVQRRVLTAVDGFDRRLPVFGSDLDFGWRAARAGFRTRVVPEAVVFHVEAARRGLRRTPLTSLRPHRAERAAALYTLLVNCSLLALPFQVVRLFLGSLLRALGFLLVRAPREAYDEMRALLGTYVRPHRILAGRAARRRTATVPAKDVRHLLAPPWLPYRHGLDFVADIATAVALSAGEASTSRRARRVETLETGPVASEAQNLPEDTGLLTRLLTSPTAGVFALLTVLSLVGMRGLLGGGLLSGGALLPAADAAADWWRLHGEAFHEVGVGSSVPAAPYVLPLALGAMLLLGKAWLLVDVLFLLVVPLAAFGGYRFLRTLTGARASALWGGVAYGLVPVLMGAVAQGRLGTVAAALVLPWCARAALFLGLEHTPDRRWRAAWRTALTLALLTAFAPFAWPVAVLLALLAVLLGGRQDPAWRARETWAPVAVAVGAVPLLLLPWSVMTFTHGHGLRTWLWEAGLPAPELLDAPGVWDLLVGRPVETGSAPGWISLGIVLAAVVALARPDTRRTVVRAWLVLLLALAALVALALVTVETPGFVAQQPVWLGLPVLLVQAAAISAAAVAGSGISTQLSGSSFSWRQPLGLAVAVVALLAPVTGLFWWAASGLDGPLDRRSVGTVPAYMTDAGSSDPDQGVLVVRSGTGDSLQYVLLRGHSVRIGEDSVAPAAEDQASLTELVGNLATAPQPEDVERLSAHGIEFVYLPPPADLTLAGNLDTVSGLTTASAVRPGARAWQVEADPTTTALPAPEGALHPWLVLVQAGALVTAGVFAAPTRKAGR
jgi:GT2 family glycosyltransferase